MDTLYIGDIPSEFHYAVFGNNYVDLYNTPNLQGTLNYYRVYLYNNYFAYDFRQTTYNQYYYSTAKDISVSSDFKYRTDFINIVSCTFIFILCGIFLTNLITSIFKKGGIFSDIF